MEHFAHLKKDKKLAKIIVEPVTELRTHKNIPLTLIESIMSQQLSTKVAQVIHKRFLALYNDKEPTLKQILDTPLPTLRSIGLSNAKTTYVHNVAKLDKKQLREKLVKISSKWSPYRTYACIYLWNWKDNNALITK